MRNRNWRVVLAGAVLVLMAGCKGGAEPGPGASPTISPTMSEDAAPAAVEATEAVDSGAPDSLSVYVGKYPLDKVGAYGFFDHPKVQEGVTRAVTDPRVAGAIAAMEGPVGPVLRKDNDIAASRCELHNCGAHNYAVHVDATTNEVTSVCYYDEKAGPIATWYKPDGAKVSEGGGCFVG